MNALEPASLPGMPGDRYPLERLDPDRDDDGTMPGNASELAQAVVGQRIVAVDQDRVPDVDGVNSWNAGKSGLALTLESGRRVFVLDTDDCCAFTELKAVLKHMDQIDHVITGVGTTDGYERKYIYADLGDVLELTVEWSSGNPFYYGYGFDIVVLDPPTLPPAPEPRALEGGDR